MDYICGKMDIAVSHGLDVAVFIENLRYWSQKNAAVHKNFMDGRYWVYHTMEGFSTLYPMWSRDQVKRIIAKCKNAGLLIAADYNDNPYKRTKWYSLSDKALALYDIQVSEDGLWRERRGEGRNRGVEGRGSAKSTAGKIAKSLKDNDEKKDTKERDTPHRPPTGDAPAHDPEAFETFWAKYPRKDNRRAAIRAWDKLKPDRPLCRTMYGALKRQRGSEQWAEEGGRYIPLFSTWLNGRKWENQGVDLSLLTGSRDPGGGWAPDPEAAL